MIQSLFIMSKTGEVMIEKHWRGITPRNVCDFFWDEVNRHDVPEAVSPILQVRGHGIRLSLDICAWCSDREQVR